MLYAIVAVLVLIADQAVKLWTTKNILLGAVGTDCVPLIPGFLHATNVHNYGAAFGIMQDARWVLALISAAFVVVIIVLMNREVIHTRFGRWLAVLIAAGAIGNCIDRVLYGYVVDMFEFEFSVLGRPFSFPVFNVADIFITVCGVLFCLHLILYREPEAVREANAPEFVRRREQKKAAKLAEKQAAKQAKAEKPAAAPERGEHKSLADELRAVDPNEPFSEWEFGAIASAPSSVRPSAPAEPEAEPTPAPASVPEPSPAPDPAPLWPAEEPAVYEAEGEEFTLDDILNEFR